MKRCSVVAWMQCPDRRGCEMYAEFADGCECDRFNEKIMRENDGKPVDPHRFQMVEWVPVTERLPEKKQSVLVYRDGDMGVDFIDDNGGWFWDDPDELPPVTHWMQIPEPPEVSSHEEN